MFIWPIRRRMLYFDQFNVQYSSQNHFENILNHKTDIFCFFFSCYFESNSFAPYGRHTPNDKKKRTEDLTKPSISNVRILCAQITHTKAVSTEKYRHLAFEKK